MNTLCRLAGVCLCAISVALARPAAAQQDEAVDLELVLAVDVSLSMLRNELEMQRKGYAAAIVHPSVLDAIARGLHRKIAVTYFEWAGDSSQRTIIPWTLIASADDARAFSEALTASRLSGMRRTSVSAAIDHAAKLFSSNGFAGLKQVIDISGDGPNNQGRPVDQARDDAVAAGLIINGLPLMTHNSSPFGSFDIPDLDAYYANCVIGGPGSFVLPVNDWDQFAEAVRRKLVQEIALGREWDAATAPPVVRIATEPAHDCLVGERMWQERVRGWDDN